MVDSSSSSTNLDLEVHPDSQLVTLGSDHVGHHAWALGQLHHRRCVGDSASRRRQVVVWITDHVYRVAAPDAGTHCTSSDQHFGQCGRG